MSPRLILLIVLALALGGGAMTGVRALVKRSRAPSASAPANAPANAPATLAVAGTARAAEEREEREAALLASAVDVAAVADELAAAGDGGAADAGPRTSTTRKGKPALVPLGKRAAPGAPAPASAAVTPVAPGKAPVAPGAPGDAGPAPVGDAGPKPGDAGPAKPKPANGADETARAVFHVGLRDELSTWLRLVTVEVSVDGKKVVSKADSKGIQATKELALYDATLFPGTHLVSARLVYKGAGGVFGYLEGYTFRRSATTTFEVKEGGRATIVVVGADRGATYEFEKRPMVTLVVAP